ncbi:MAG: sarcosine oxidase subunit gamma family protein [Oleiphilaceae bacterium]|nr:sarcosine oxidase subunit gamma family protein [Oleiphilaceae bacterium]
MSKVEVFQQQPSGAVAAESPFHFSRQRNPLAPAKGEAGVIMAERPFLTHLILRGTPEVLLGGVRNVTGLTLPQTPCSMNSKEDKSLQWLAPDEWLLILPPGSEFSTEKALRGELGDGSYAIVNVSGGQTVLELSGPNAREVLMKSTSCDLHPRTFPEGRGVSTVFAKTGAIIRRPDAQRWELVIRRSFADYLYRWLLSAGAEYGITTQER